MRYIKRTFALIPVLAMAAGLVAGGRADAALAKVFFAHVPAPAADKALDCTSGAYTIDGADVDAAEVSAKSDGKGGCDLHVKFAKSVDGDEFDASFHDAAAKEFVFFLKLSSIQGSAPASMVAK